MTNTNHDPFLYFNFSGTDGKEEKISFTNPSQIISAWTIKDIMPCLEKVQQAVNDGNYAAGFLSYEAAPAFDPSFKVRSGNKMPLLWFGIFKEPTSLPKHNPQAFETTEWKPTVNIDDYNENIDKVHSFIREGKTKQVNYTIHFESEVKGDTFAFYKQLEQVQSNYSSYVDIGDFSILSASPELFFELKNGKIITKPMKGTVGRGKTYDEDIKNAKWLKDSKKNRNENEMIIKLMSKDLEAVAAPGTVNLKSSFDIEMYPTVYQMTSTVTAEIAPNKTVIDIIKALFPSGSITGLPKQDTMEVITELETAPREVYCGALGFITPDNEAIFNVPIRTVLIDNSNGHAEYGVGGAITIDSTKEEEYEEVLTKSSVLNKKPKVFDLLETIGLFNGEYFVLDNHLKRLAQSAKYFNFKVDIDNIKNTLAEIAIENKDDDCKVRVTNDRDGEYSISVEPIIPITGKVLTSLADKPIDKNELFLYHKTTYRNMYELHHDSDDVFDVLLWNEDNEVTEFTMGNVVVELNNKLVTPPVESGLLAGTFRSALLESGEISEGVITLEELQQCENIWFINSVRKWIPVDLNLK